MVLGRVVGKAVSSAKHASLVGSRLLIVNPIRASSLEPLLVIDQLGARAGDVVVMSHDGKFAREMVKDGTSPVRWWVMGIVDNPQSILEETK